jgi:hypothetical protein
LTHIRECIYSPIIQNIDLQITLKAYNVHKNEAPNMACLCPHSYGAKHLKFRCFTLFTVTKHSSQKIILNNGDDDEGEAYHPQHHVNLVVAHYG